MVAKSSTLPRKKILYSNYNFIKKTKKKNKLKKLLINLYIFFEHFLLMPLLLFLMFDKANLLSIYFFQTYCMI